MGWNGIHQNSTGRLAGPPKTWWLIGTATGRSFVEHLACVSAACYSMPHRAAWRGRVEASTVQLAAGRDSSLQQQQQQQPW